MTKKFNVGDRVVVNQTAGFDRGARGVITSIDPQNPNKVWICRDGSDSSLWWMMDELDTDVTVAPPTPVEQALSILFGTRLTGFPVGVQKELKDDLMLTDEDMKLTLKQLIQTRLHDSLCVTSAFHTIFHVELGKK